MEVPRISVASGVPVEGSGPVGHLADAGRLDLTMVKIDGIPAPDPYGYLQLQSKEGLSWIDYL